MVNETLEGGRPVVLDNEFARVEIRLDRGANGPRLQITDLRTSKKIFLDPLELLSLSWSMHRDLVTHLDPSRWWSEFAEDMELRLALASPVSADGQNGQYGTDGRGG